MKMLVTLRAFSIVLCLWFVRVKCNYSPLVYKEFIVNFMEAKLLRHIAFFQDLSNDKWGLLLEGTFILISKEGNFFSRFLNFDANNTHTLLDDPKEISQIEKDRVNLQVIVMTLYTQQHLSTLNEFFKKENVGNQFWLLLTDEISEYLIKELFLQPNFQMVFASYQKESNCIEVSDQYKTVSGGIVHKTVINIWESNVSSTKDFIEKFRADVRNFCHWRERFNLSEVFLSTVISNSPSYIHTDISETGKVELSGPVGNIWNYLQEHLKFKYSVKFSETDVYGSYNESSKSWIGLIKELQEKRYNICLGDVSIVSSRYSTIDFLTPFDEQNWFIVYQTPSRRTDSIIDSSFLHYVAEFMPVVWMAIGITFFVCCVCLRIICTLHPKENLFTFCDITFLVFSYFCNIGFEKRLHTFAGKIFTFTVSLTFFLLLAHYSSFLTSSLATETLKLPIKDLDGLYAKRNYYKLVVIRGSSLQFFFQNSTLDLMKNIWKDMRFANEEFFPRNFEEMFSLLAQNNRMATVVESDLARLKMESGIVYFMVHSQSNIAFATQKGFALKNIFDHFLRKLIESGIYKRERKRYWIKLQKRKKSRTNDSVWNPIEINDIFLPLLILTCGILLSVVILIVELFTMK